MLCCDVPVQGPTSLQDRTMCAHTGNICPCGGQALHVCSIHAVILCCLRHLQAPCTPQIQAIQELLHQLLIATR